MAIKSAYELAMQRLAKESPGTGRKLSAADKTKLAELDQRYTAKIPEVELDLQPKIAAARAGTARAGADPEVVKKLEETLRTQVQKLRDKLEAEKDQIRQGTAKNS